MRCRCSTAERRPRPDQPAPRGRAAAARRPGWRRAAPVARSSSGRVDCRSARVPGGSAFAAPVAQPSSGRAGRRPVRVPGGSALAAPVVPGRIRTTASARPHARDRTRGRVVDCAARRGRRRSRRAVAGRRVRADGRGRRSWRVVRLCRRGAPGPRFRGRPAGPAGGPARGGAPVALGCAERVPPERLRRIRLDAACDAKRSDRIGGTAPAQRKAAVVCPCADE